jgi:hypothetical protein
MFIELNYWKQEKQAKRSSYFKNHQLMAISNLLLPNTNFYRSDFLENNLCGYLSNHFFAKKYGTYGNDSEERNSFQE